MTTRTLTLLVALIGAIAWPSAAAAKRPNVLFIFTDDQRPDAFSALGNPDIKTPNMDRIINSGFVFNQAYIQGSMTGATCLPSRAVDECRCRNAAFVLIAVPATRIPRTLLRHFARRFVWVQR